MSGMKFQKKITIRVRRLFVAELAGELEAMNRELAA